MSAPRIRGSRRLFLSGLLATFSVTPGAVIAGRPFHEADRAFITWLGAVGIYNRQTIDVEDGQPDPYWEAVEAAEQAFRELPPCPMALAGRELFELSYAAPCDVSLSRCRTVETHERVRTLECIRPLLSGLIGRVAGDLLDNQRRPLGESMLWRLRAKGGVS